MTKQAQNKPLAAAASKKPHFVVSLGDGRTVAVSALACEVVERHAAKALAGNVLRQSGTYKSARAPRVPQLLSMDRDIRELQKAVEALALLSVVHDQSAKLSDSVDSEGMTVLDADTAYQLLDNPPEPNQALRNLLALR